jgi:hypothetical protein
VVILNGKKIVDADLDRCRKDPQVAKEHPGLARTTGRVGLQSHSERVEFRNLRIKEIKEINHEKHEKHEKKEKNKA